MESDAAVPNRPNLVRIRCTAYLVDSMPLKLGFFEKIAFFIPDEVRLKFSPNLLNQLTLDFSFLSPHTRVH